ncbi:MAG: 4-hydroxyphenylacetate 3-hydroxylase [Acidimicrobiia bacterium]|nr:4-hydroxyphenylacetate 3-hydroxylase [Acidimicrobiia bacterium]
MGARSGVEYLESLRVHQPEVWLSGKRVEDVTCEPTFAGPLASVMEQYDLQLDPRHCGFALTDGYSSSFLVPRSKEDLIRRRQTFKLRTDHSFGFMGRAPDFMNAILTDFSLLPDLFASGGSEAYGDNIVAYHRHIRDNDLFLTHMLINPQVDRSKTSAQQEDPFTHLGRVSETSEGIIVRGAKMLGTMAPLCEEVMVWPFGGVREGDEAYALAFGIPTNSPGLRFICRETFAPPGRSRFDHPLSSRFEEMDCIAVFDDVLVPWDRVFVDGGGPAAREVCNRIRPRDGTVAVQTSARMLSSLEFLCGLAMRLADAVGIDEFLHVQEKLGELLIELEGFRAAFYGAESLASEQPNGVWSVHQPFLAAANLRAPRLYPRVVEIIQTLAAGGLFYAPTEADLAAPEIRTDIDRFVRGRPGVDAEERIALFKLAWDAIGDSFGSRMLQYARYYSGDPIRNWAGWYLGYPYKDDLSDTVDRALGVTSETGQVDDLDIPPSPWDPSDRIPGRRPAAGTMQGTYPSED